MMDHPLNANYWEDRYKLGHTGWDLGHISAPLKQIIDRLEQKDAKILIPGAGNGFEAAYLWKAGFKHTVLLDWAPSPLRKFSEQHPDFPSDQLICSDFFDHQGKYDIILEQTFFCALPPNQRMEYVRQIHALLKPSGSLQGVLFGVPMNENRPPYGGSKMEYEKLFDPCFHLEKLITCTSSEPDRIGLELEINFIRKETSNPT